MGIWWEYDRHLSLNLGIWIGASLESERNLMGSDRSLIGRNLTFPVRHNTPAINVSVLAPKLHWGVWREADGSLIGIWWHLIGTELNLGIWKEADRRWESDVGLMGIWWGYDRNLMRNQSRTNQGPVKNQSGTGWPPEDQFMMIVLLTKQVVFKDPGGDYTAGLKLPVHPRNKRGAF